MSFAQVMTRSVVGLSAPKVMVEVHLSQGLPALTIVGLAEAAVRESKDRVRSAIINSGYEFPNRRLTINLAPADLPKDGARLDLAISIGILVASGQLDQKSLDGLEFIGELGLNGELRSVSGALTVARTIGLENTKNTTQTALIMPTSNAYQSAKVPQVAIFGADNLQQVCQHLNAVVSTNKSDDLLQQAISQASDEPTLYPLDLADIKGQHFARRALEIAATGGHSLLFKGPPGAGKTLLASRLPSILPPLTDSEALDVASIYSVANLSYTFGVRPFRAVHHTISAVALVGGGSKPKPGEITLASKGVLFLDEMPEFDKKALEVLRQPLESRQIVISRANSQVDFPADFQLVGAMNPCPCGYHNDGTDRCQCSPAQIERYQDRLSGPILDRIDLQVTVPALPISDLQTHTKGESSSIVRQRVIKARNIAISRQGVPNSELSTSQLDEVAKLDDDCQRLLANAVNKLHLSARSYHRILRVARTIADLACESDIRSVHLAESLSYRG